MIDFHTHVLPGLDDGAHDVDTAKTMLQMQLDQGVDTVLLTSHYYGKKHSPSQFLEKRKEAFERLAPHIPQGVSVRLGAEVHFTGINTPDYEELCHLAIEGTDYMLVELPFTTKWTNDLMERLSDFVYETGCTPIIAHVERYQEVLKNPAIVSELVNMGCLIQVNARAFSEKSEKNFAFALLKHGLVHCIGSDAHDAEHRLPDVASAKTAMEKAGYADAWNAIQTLMKRVLNNDRIVFQGGRPIKKFFGRYF